jgi:general stress protein CsbA
MDKMKWYHFVAVWMIILSFLALAFTFHALSNWAITIILLLMISGYLIIKYTSND